MSQEERRCYACGNDRPIEEFAFKSRHTGERCHMCKPCNREYQRARYQARSSEYKQKAKTHRLKTVEQNDVRMQQYLLSHPCEKCGEPDMLVLEFHHVAGKESEISKLLHDGCSWQRIEREIKKCQVLCANCHKRVTAHQLGWRKVNWPVRLTA